ncbi:MAG: hypothetical protein ACJ72J_05190 [Nitrososphaeraceae archaeon]
MIKAIHSFRSNDSIILASPQPKSPICSLGDSCLILDEAKLRAKVQHISRGKFKILVDKNGDKYTNNIVDASDIFHCR